MWFDGHFTQNNFGSIVSSGVQEMCTLKGYRQ